MNRQALSPKTLISTIVLLLSIYSTEAFGALDSGRSSHLRQLLIDILATTQSPLTSEVTMILDPSNEGLNQIISPSHDTLLSRTSENEGDIIGLNGLKSELIKYCSSEEKVDEAIATLKKLALEKFNLQSFPKGTECRIEKLATTVKGLSNCQKVTMVIISVPDPLTPGTLGNKELEQKHTKDAGYIFGIFPESIEHPYGAIGIYAVKC